MGQAEYDAARRERKARAAVTVAANAKAAAKAKAKATKGVSLGQEDFLAKAAQIEKDINTPKDEKSSKKSDTDTPKEES